MKKNAGAILFLLALCMAACASIPTKTWTSTPEVLRFDFPEFRGSLEPLRKGGNFFETFLLTITNKSDRNIEIDWNQTRYLFNGHKRGGFVYKGIAPEDLKNLTIPADIVKPGDTFSREIAPVRLVARAPLGAKGVGVNQPGISPGIIPQGENGISLATRHEGRETLREITLRIESMEVK